MDLINGLSLSRNREPINFLSLLLSACLFYEYFFMSLSIASFLK